MEKELSVSTSNNVLEAFQDVSILGLNQDKTTYAAGQFHIYILLSTIPEKFWMGCFEQIKIQLYKNSSVFPIKDQYCMLVVNEENAQLYLDELKKVIKETNNLFRQQLLEVEMEKQQMIEEQKIAKLKIETLHKRLVI